MQLEKKPFIVPDWNRQHQNEMTASSAVRLTYLPNYELDHTTLYCDFAELHFPLPVLADEKHEYVNWSLERFNYIRRRDN